MPLTVLVTHQDGYVTRLGADEPDAAGIPLSVSWGSRLPGGWDIASFHIRRRGDEDIPLRLLDEVLILDEHNQVMFMGRVAKLPIQQGEDFMHGVDCVSWAAHLLDDPSVPYFFVDRDMSGWREPGLERRVQAGSIPYGVDYQASSDGGYIRFDGPGDAAGGRTILQNSTAELAYEAPVGTKVASIAYTGTEANTTSTTSIDFSTDDNRAFSSSSASSLTLNGALQTLDVTDDRFAGLAVAATANHTPTAGFAGRLSKLALYGNHGLTSVSYSATEPNGFYIDDMLAWALSRGAPKLYYTTGADGTIQRPPIVVPHASDGGLGTIERIILDLNKYVIWDWLIYDSWPAGSGVPVPTFYYRPTDPDRLTWEARLDQGALLDLEGDDVERAVNGVLVSYTTFDGTQKVAGPVGSGMDVESSLLQDTDTEGTVNAHGYTRKWIDYPVNFSLADDSYAPIIGAAYLAQTQLPARSGNITLPQVVGHPTKGDRPAREVRAGDWIKISDHPADVPRRIIAANHDNDTRTTTVSVGNDLNKVDALLEQAALASRVAVGAAS